MSGSENGSHCKSKGFFTFLPGQAHSVESLDNQLEGTTANLLSFSKWRMTKFLYRSSAVIICQGLICRARHGGIIQVDWWWRWQIKISAFTLTWTKVTRCRCHRKIYLHKFCMKLVRWFLVHSKHVPDLYMLLAYMSVHVLLLQVWHMKYLYKFSRYHTCDYLVQVFFVHANSYTLCTKIVQNWLVQICVGETGTCIVWN